MNITAKQKRVIVISGLLFVAVLVCGIGIKYILPAFRRPTPWAPSRILGYCKEVAITTRLYYYQELEGNVPQDPAPGLVSFLIKAGPNFSREAPAEGYKSVGDSAFYLFLPPKLESPSPLLIAYSGPFGENERLYRGTLFLRGYEIVVVVLSEAELIGIVGRETFENKKPDFYVWRLRSKYLEEQSDKSN